MPDIAFSLGWVIVYVDAADEAARFYEATFGLHVEFTAPDGLLRAARHRRDEARVRVVRARRQELPRRRPPRRSRPASPPNVEIALVTAGRRRGLRAGARRRLRVARRRPEDKPQGQRVAYVRDPFGTLVELATPL